jgi:hypothetical protein
MSTNTLRRLVDRFRRPAEPAGPVTARHRTCTTCGTSGTWYYGGHVRYVYGEGDQRQCRYGHEWTDTPRSA